eukprot:TRINITY_DN1185_c0_g3_i2.p1 TRINITY_DN1185_c0_g3~~TRINITY_DN1185_c0_g3_i2.p1  ORF type:complete len:274 (-),score=31.01 TRINITY_DN1185_c0_g3_i2:200-1021(-)
MLQLVDPPVLIMAAAHLRMADVARWRAVDMSTKTIFDVDGDDNVWLNCAQTQFTTDRLLAWDELYEIPHRKLCFKFHSMLQRTNYMFSDNPLLIEGVEEAACVEHRLREAMHACSQHRATSGRDAHVLLGLFKIFGPGDAIATFRFGAEGYLPTIAGLPPGILFVRMAYEEEQLKICAMYGTIHGNVIKAFHEAEKLQFTLSVACADRDLSLSCRCIPLILDGRVRASACRCECPSDLECDIDWPVLYVLRLFEGDVSDSRHCIVNALNFEHC